MDLEWCIFNCTSSFQTFWPGVFKTGLMLYVIWTTVRFSLIFLHPTPTVEFCLLQPLVPGCSLKWQPWTLHSLALVKLVRDVENTKKTTWFRELEHPLRQGEARTVYIVERGTDMTGLPAEEERAKKWCQKKLFNLNSLLISEVNCILPLPIWLLMG